MSCTPAATVFRHVTTYSNFVAASDAPFDLGADERRANLLLFKRDTGEAMFAQDQRHRAALERLATAPLPERRAEYLAKQGLWRITDDNMAVEYKVR